MDLGTSTWTEFQMSEDVASYMANNIELFDCDIALVHSHHNMGAFFSGQDIKMLQQEGNDTNCFVSLVVDTKGTYVAVVTRKVKIKYEITTKNLDKSYDFFGEGSKTISQDNNTVTKVIEKEVIEYFDLEIERHEVHNSLEYLDNRFNEITQKKQQKVITNINDNQPISQPTLFNYDFKDNKLNPTSINVTKKNAKTINNLIATDWTPNPKAIHSAIVHLLTCNLILNPDKIDLKQWVTKHMVNVYKKIFGENSVNEALYNGSGAFTEWKDFIIQYTLDYFDYSDAPDPILEKYGEAEAKVIEAILDELYEYTNIPYVQAYYDALMNFLN